MSGTNQVKSSAYGGRTSCGHPSCAPDPDLVRQLDTATELLEALEALVAERPACYSAGCDSCDWCQAEAAIAKARGENQ